MYFVTSPRASVPTAEDFLSVRREMDHWFDRVVGSTGQSLQALVPPVSVSETENEILVTAEIPGITAADVEVTVENGTLTLRGEKKPGPGDQGNPAFNERRFGRFERSFALARGVVADDIRAGVENGLLMVHLPKTAEAKPRRIQVEQQGNRERIEAGTR